MAYPDTIKLRLTKQGLLAPVVLRWRYLAGQRLQLHSSMYSLVQLMSRKPRLCEKCPLLQTHGYGQAQRKRLHQVKDRRRNSSRQQTRQYLLASERQRILPEWIEWMLSSVCSSPLRKVHSGDSGDYNAMWKTTTPYSQCPATQIQRYAVATLGQ